MYYTIENNNDFLIQVILNKMILYDYNKKKLRSISLDIGKQL